MTTETKALAKKEAAISPIDKAVLGIMDIMHRRSARLELLLPKGADVARFKESIRFALAAQPALGKCTPESLVLAVMRGARTGLPVDGGGGLAWIVPYGTEATYVPGYKGLITLAKATGLVKDMQPIPVYKRDSFSYSPADDQPLRHEVYFPETDDADDDRGPLRIVYCKTVLPDGSRRYDVMSLKDIRVIQAKSRAKNGPWSSDFERMALKSVVKRAFATLGVPPGDTYKALRLALAADVASETGEMDAELDAVESTARPSANVILRERLGVGASALTEGQETLPAEITEEEKAEILRQEMAAAEPGSTG